MKTRIENIGESAKRATAYREKQVGFFARDNSFQRKRKILPFMHTARTNYHPMRDRPSQQEH